MATYQLHYNLFSTKTVWHLHFTQTKLLVNHTLHSSTNHIVLIHWRTPSLSRASGKAISFLLCRFNGLEPLDQSYFKVGSKQKLCVLQNQYHPNHVWPITTQLTKTRNQSEIAMKSGTWQCVNPVHDWVVILPNWSRNDKCAFLSVRVSCTNISRSKDGTNEKEI